MQPSYKQSGSFEWFVADCSSHSEDSEFEDMQMYLVFYLKIIIPFSNG